MWERSDSWQILIQFKVRNCICKIAKVNKYYYTYNTDTLPSADILTTPQLQSTSVPRNRENDCTCSECSSSAVAAVSAVSLLLIVILTTVVLTQCLLMVRMRKSKDAMHRNETYAEVMTPSTMHADVPVSPNEAYTLQKMTNSSEEAVYELIN